LRLALGLERRPLYAQLQVPNANGAVGEQEPEIAIAGAGRLAAHRAGRLLHAQGRLDQVGFEIAPDIAGDVTSHRIRYDVGYVSLSMRGPEAGHQKDTGESRGQKRLSAHGADASCDRARRQFRVNLNDFLHDD
jgi:hypothetical protein